MGEERGEEGARGREGAHESRGHAHAGGAAQQRAGPGSGLLGEAAVSPCPMSALRGREAAGRPNEPHPEPPALKQVCLTSGPAP